MTNIATHKVHQYLKTNNLGRVITPVHDELVCSAKIGFTDQVKSAIIEIMESTNNDLNFKYHIKAKAYGDFKCWQKA